MLFGQTGAQAGNPRSNRSQENFFEAFVQPKQQKQQKVKNVPLGQILLKYNNRRSCECLR